MIGAAPLSATAPGAIIGHEVDAGACRMLARLMAGLPFSDSPHALPEPFPGIVCELSLLPVQDRLDTLINRLEEFADIDVDTVLSRIFEINPLESVSEASASNSFSSAPLYTENSETNYSETAASSSTPITSTAVNSLQSAGNGESNSEGLTAVALSAFLEVQDPPQEWCVELIFPMEAASIMASPGGWGKSWMLLDLAIETARGGRWLGRFNTQKLRVLYVDEESSPRLLRRRLRKLLRGKNLNAEDLDIHFVVGKGFSLSHPKSVAELKRLLEQLQPGLVIFDSLIRIHEAEENSASEMAKVFAVVKDLIRQSKAAFVIADHQRKPGFMSTNLDVLLRGSSEKKAFVDCLLSMQKKDGALIVEHSKSRHESELPAFVVRIEDSAPGATVVRCIGDAEGLKVAAKQEQMDEFLHSAIPQSEWAARKDLVTRAKTQGITSRLLDETLKTLVATEQLERDDRKPSSGPGGKQAHYRWSDEPKSLHIDDSAETNSDGDI